MNLTFEQESIVHAVFNYPTILVNAFAGTGKTTTCMATIREANKRNLKVLYLVFNKAMSDEAKRKAKDLKVDIRTVHSLAYYELAKRGYFTNRQVSNIKVKDVSLALDIPYRLAFWVLEFFNQFLFSPFDFNQIEDFVSQKVQASLRFRHGYEEVGSELIPLLQKLTKKVKNKELPTPHDFYLKEFVLSDLSSNLSYDLVILDESQDANPLFIELLKKIPAKHRLLVGDKHQRIYQFRNTVDAFRFFDSPIILYLTQTFRFGSNISDLANTVLAFKGERKRIQPTSNPKQTSKPHAVISYTNSSLLEYYLISTHRESMAFERDIKEVIKPVLTILSLKEDYIDSSLPLDYSLLNSFRSFSDLQDYIYLILSSDYNSDEEKALTDRELIQAYFLSEKLSLDDALIVLKEYNQNKNKPKQVYLTTAHSSKGLEYDTTTLLPDLAIPEDNLQLFSESLHNHQPISPDIIASINLLYVALTRASLSTSLPQEIQDTLDLMANTSQSKAMWSFLR